MKTPFVYKSYYGQFRRAERVGFREKGVKLATNSDGSPYVQPCDEVALSSEGFVMTRGKCDAVRVIPEAYVEQLDNIDIKIKALQQEARELAEEAFRRGTPITKTRAKAEQAARTEEWKKQRDQAQGQVEVTR